MAVAQIERPGLSRFILPIAGLIAVGLCLGGLLVLLDPKGGPNLLASIYDALGNTSGADELRNGQGDQLVAKIILAGIALACALDGSGNGNDGCPAAGGISVIEIVLNVRVAAVADGLAVLTVTLAQAELLLPVIGNTVAVRVGLHSIGNPVVVGIRVQRIMVEQIGDSIPVRVTVKLIGIQPVRHAIVIQVVVQPVPNSIAIAVGIVRTCVKHVGNAVAVAIWQGLEQ
jgi:hypothetical protein